MGVDSTPKMFCEKHFRPGAFNLLSSRANLHLSYNLILWAAVIADYKIIMDILIIIIGAWTACQVT